MDERGPTATPPPVAGGPGAKTKRKQVLSVSLSPDLVQALERRRADGQGRSETVRAALRLFLHRDRHAGDAPRDAVVVMQYADHARAAASGLRDRHEALVRSFVHHHAGGRCLDVLLVNGRPAELDRLLDDLRMEDAVLFAELVPVPAPDVPAPDAQEPVAAEGP